MKNLNPLFIAVLLWFTVLDTSLAGDLSGESIQGKWLFTHITMEDGMEIKVNYYMDFLPGGVLVNYDALGNEKSRGSYEISGEEILYRDSNGAQEWKVISIEDNALHVDHKGAQMYFEKT